MNARNLQLTKDEMLRAGPDHFDMDVWFRDEEEFIIEISLIGTGELDEINNCGTTACFGGFARLAIIRSEGAGRSPATQEEVAEWLGVPLEVFFPLQWKTGGVVTEDLQFLQERWLERFKGILPPDPMTNPYSVYSAEYVEYSKQLKRAEFHTILDYIDWKLAQS